MLHVCRCLLAATLAIVFLGPLGWAAPPKAGDRVEIKQEADWVPGKVISVDGDEVVVQLDSHPSVPDYMPAEDRAILLERHVAVSDVRPSPSAGEAGRTKEFPGSREWTDTSGKFKVAAIFRGVENGKVTLERADGKSIVVPLAKLCRDDRDFIAQHDTVDDPFSLVPSEDGPSATPAKPVEPPPTRDSQPGRIISIPPSPPAGASSSGESQAGLPTMTPPPARRLGKNGDGPKFFGSKNTGELVRGTSGYMLSPQTFDSWSFTPRAPSATNAPTALKPLGVRLTAIPNSKTFFEKVGALRVSTDRSRVFIARQCGGMGGADGAYIEELELPRGKSEAMYEMPHGTMIVDIEPDSRLVAYGKAEHERITGSTLLIARLGDNGLEPLSEFEISDGSDKVHDKTYDSARFVGSSRLLVAPSFFGDIVSLWDVNEKKQLVQIPVGKSLSLDSGLCISDDGTLLALPMSEGVAIIDLVAGEHVATVPTDQHQHFVRVAFSADNQRMAVAGTNSVRVWNLADGKAIADVRHSIINPMMSVNWSGPFLLLDAKYVFDVDRNILLWEYNDGMGSFDDSATIGKGVLVSYNRASGDSPGSVLVVPVPDSKVLNFAKTLPPADKLIALRKGDSVKLEVEVDETIAQSLVVRGQLHESLVDAGLIVDDEAPIVVRAVCKTLPSQQIHLGPWGVPSWRLRQEDVTTHTITPTITALTVEQGKKILFRRSNMGVPGHLIRLEDGESPDAALQRLTQPRPELISKWDISLPLSKQGDATPSGAYGTSSLLGTKVGKGGRFE